MRNIIIFRVMKTCTNDAQEFDVVEIVVEIRAKIRKEL